MKTLRTLAATAALLMAGPIFGYAAEAYTPANAPLPTIQGALTLMDRLSHWLKTLTGMPAVALSPKAGAHGELCGLMAIRAAHEASGQHEKRRKVLVPTSAHGTPSCRSPDA